MPYEIKPVSGGYFVVNRDTGKQYSKEPLDKTRAEAQFRVLEQVHAKEEAERFEKHIDFETLKNTVLNVKCRKINMTEVEAIKTKKELIKYLREHECPVLRRQEALLESVYNK
jgi:UDP-N-acetylmuramate-alanine ligase